ncbi:DUF3883 domain-containing protein [Hymenobacter persicinus]|uniref:DUF3883 domain-containing protein n=1 Tax=Hymenobacter persicinus TaxID=2025506 RepID=A0A4Q5LG76_9BACT|nr:DUF3883 domain-containing protein [Hymenobacter persicinus]RYU84759.1 DUF3883 domain-containing protein [Hymenobacter persicinus]
MHPKEFIAELYQKRAVYNHHSQAYTVARLLKTVSTDIYSDSLRFLFELIQNADDAALGTENEVHFQFLPGYLITCHQGKAFTEGDIDAITDADASTKTADPTKTGYKGIGFKAVFAKSKRVVIWSGGYQFKFDQEANLPKYPWQIIPIWVESDELPTEVAQFIAQNTYKVYTCLELDSTTKLEEELKHLLNPQLLLFLRRVGRISVASPTQPSYSISRQRTDHSAAYQHVTLIDQEQRTATWLLKIFDQLPVPEALSLEMAEDDKTPEKLRLATVTEVAFAARIEGNTLIPLRPEESRLYTYLPTEETGFAFPFLVNGTFFTTSSRQSLHVDSKWNQWLFELLAEKLLDWLELLAGSEYGLQLLAMLPKRFNSSSQVLKQRFDQGLAATIASRRLVLSTDLTPKTISESLLDETGLAAQSFIDPANMLTFWAATKGAAQANSFVNPAFAHATRLMDYGLTVFRLEHVEPFFRSSNFTEHHAVADNFALLAYFKEKADSDHSGDWFATLQDLPFIYDTSEVLRSPETGVCFPAEVGDASTELGDIPVIHSAVFDQLSAVPPLHKWLEKLGVKRPSEITYITNVLVPALRAGEEVITEASYLQVTNYLFRLHQEGSLSAELVEALRELPLKTSDGQFVAAQHCYLASAYHPLLPLEKTIAELSFVSESYLGNGSGFMEWNQFFKRLKVKDRIELEAITANNSLTALASITNPNWLTAAEAQAQKLSRGFGFGSHNLIAGLKLPSFLNLTASNFKYGQLFWNTLLKQEVSPEPLVAKVLYFYGVGGGRNSYRIQVDNYFTWFVAEQPCIPTTTGKLLPAHEVFLNNKDTEEIAGKYLPVFDCSIRPNQAWRDVLKLRLQLQTTDYLSVLGSIATDGERSQPTPRVLKTIGLVYKALSYTALDGLPEDHKAIRQWAAKNRLVSSTLAFEQPSNLLWIKLDGFANLAGQVKSMYVPANADATSAGFTALMNLFKIRIVESYTPNVVDPQPEPSLKSKLLNIMPALAALYAKKHFTELDDIYQQAKQQVLQTTFYQAAAVRICFSDKGQIVESDPLDVLREPQSFFFTAAWDSPLALYWLLPELESLLTITGLRQELRLLLELQPAVARGWLATQGIDEDVVLAYCLTLDAHTTYDEPEAVPLPVYVDVPPLGAAIRTPFSTPVTESSWSFKPSVTPEEVVLSDQPVGARSWHPAPIVTFTPTEMAASATRLASEADRVASGEWSEAFVKRRLTSQSSRFSSIEWVNEHGESRLPYDFRVVENGVEKYIEVKGTPSAEKGEFYYSVAEWKWMFAHKDRYSIYRVFEAGEDTAYEVVIENPSEYLLRGELLPVPIVLTL